MTCWCKAFWVPEPFSFTLRADRKRNRKHLFVEKRDPPRLKIYLPVEVELSEGEIIRTEISNLSFGGAFVRLKDRNGVRLSELGELLVVRILYCYGEKLEIPNARIVRVCSNEVETGLGIRFVDLDAKAQNLLTLIIKGSLGVYGSSG